MMQQILSQPMAVLLTGVLLLSGCATHRAATPPRLGIFQKGTRVLFQGDSITDGNRGRNQDPNHILGHGYAFIVAAKCGAAFPELDLTFLNRGISGNKVTDLAGRWQQDTLDLKPDVLSILIGVNDNGKVPLDEYEAVYDRLLTDARAANPKLRLVLCEPFTLPVGGVKARWESWRAELKQRQEIVARLAHKHKAVLVRFQAAFDAACAKAPPEYWIWDGVHPTYAGHQVMADEWVHAIERF
jgi:lysophospholipase L1-like esterase